MMANDGTAGDDRRLAAHYGESEYDPHDHAPSDDGEPCCPVAEAGAGHALTCPRHNPATCPTCHEHIVSVATKEPTR